MTGIPNEPSAAPRLGRSLYAPGPQPPLSHLGATLMRHVVGTVVRYSLYQLGLPMPDAPPVRILRLRVFLDAAPLEPVLGTEPGGAEVLAALLRPGGAGELDADVRRMRAAVALHRGRLALLGPRRGRGAAAGRAGNRAEGEPPLAPPDLESTSGSASGEVTDLDRARLWAAVCSILAGRMPYLCDAALGELVAALARRRRRLMGQIVPPALGQIAWQVHSRRDADLRALGAPDPFQASWSELPATAEELADRCARARAAAPLPARPGRRGAFREAYRWVLSEVRPLLLALGARARDEGIVDRADDVFFVPFDLGAELAAARRPSWLAAAVATNRREHEALRREPEHADEIEGPPALAPLEDRSTRWAISPLLPVE